MITTCFRSRIRTVWTIPRRDWLYVIDHVRGIDLIFHKGKIAETYNIGGFNEWKNIDIIKVLIKTSTLIIM